MISLHYTSHTKAYNTIYTACNIVEAIYSFTHPLLQTRLIQFDVHGFKRNIVHYVILILLTVTPIMTYIPYRVGRYDEKEYPSLPPTANAFTSAVLLWYRLVFRYLE